VLYRHVLGDKDTFGFAFAMAGKLHEMYAVAVPPAAAFKHEVGWLQTASAAWWGSLAGWWMGLLDVCNISYMWRLHLAVACGIRGRCANGTTHCNIQNHHDSCAKPSYAACRIGSGFACS